MRKIILGLFSFTFLYLGSAVRAQSSTYSPQVPVISEEYAFWRILAQLDSGKVAFNEMPSFDEDYKRSAPPYNADEQKIILTYLDQMKSKGRFALKPGDVIKIVEAGGFPDSEDQSLQTAFTPTISEIQIPVRYINPNAYSQMNLEDELILPRINPNGPGAVEGALLYRFIIANSGRHELLKDLEVEEVDEQILYHAIFGALYPHGYGGVPGNPGYGGAGLKEDAWRISIVKKLRDSATSAKAWNRMINPVCGGLNFFLRTGETSSGVNKYIGNFRLQARYSPIVYPLDPRMCVLVYEPGSDGLPSSEYVLINDLKYLENTPFWREFFDLSGYTVAGTGESPNGFFDARDSGPVPRVIKGEANSWLKPVRENNVGRIPRVVYWVDLLPTEKNQVFHLYARIDGNTSLTAIDDIFLLVKYDPDEMDFIQLSQDFGVGTNLTATPQLGYIEIKGSTGSRNFVNGDLFKLQFRNNLDGPPDNTGGTEIPDKLYIRDPHTGDEALRTHSGQPITHKIEPVRYVPEPSFYSGLYQVITPLQDAIQWPGNELTRSWTMGDWEYSRIHGKYREPPVDLIEMEVGPVPNDPEALPAGLYKIRWVGHDADPLPNLRIVGHEDKLYIKSSSSLPIKDIGPPGRGKEYTLAVSEFRKLASDVDRLFKITRIRSAGNQEWVTLSDSAQTSNLEWNTGGLSLKTTAPGDQSRSASEAAMVAFAESMYGWENYRLPSPHIENKITALEIQGLGKVEITEGNRHTHILEITDTNRLSLRPIGDRGRNANVPSIDFKSLYIIPSELVSKVEGFANKTLTR